MESFPAFFRLAELQARRLPADFSVNGHLGALVALRDLGPKGCRELLRKKCHGEPGQWPAARLAKQEAERNERLSRDFRSFFFFFF